MMLNNCLLRLFVIIFILISGLSFFKQNANAGAPVTTITIVNLDSAGEGLNDPFLVMEVGGNTGTTRGVQRLNVLKSAANMWANVLHSTVGISIGASFDPDFCDTDSAVLASAGPTFIIRDSPGLPFSGTWYPIAHGNALATFKIQLPASTDGTTSFNSNLDADSSCLSGGGWYYGLDHMPPAGKIDLLTVVKHEFGHIFAHFYTESLSSGALFMGFPSIYLRFLSSLFIPPSGPTQLPLGNSGLDRKRRRDAFVDNQGLLWNGMCVKNFQLDIPLIDGVDLPSSFVRLYAPSGPFTPVPGSSVSHWDTSLDPDQLLEPFITSDGSSLGLSTALSRDTGWPIVGLFGIKNGSFTVDLVEASFTTNVLDPPAPGPCMEFPLEFLFTARVTNTSTTPLSLLKFQVFDLPPTRTLGNADGGAGGIGAFLNILQQDGYSDGILSFGEFVDVLFMICIENTDSFLFFVNLFAQEVCVPISSAASESLQAVQQLIHDINGLTNDTPGLINLSANSQQGMTGNLTNSILGAINTLSDENTNNDNGACGNLNGFKKLINKYERKGELDNLQASQLRDSADNIMNILGCR